MEKLSINDILKYEVHSNWIAPYMFFGWGQDLLGWYIGQKVKRKYKRYLSYIQIREHILEQSKNKYSDNEKRTQLF